MVTPIQATEHHLRDFHIIQSIQQLPPLQILRKSALRPENTSFGKTLPLGHPGSPFVPETSEPLSPGSSNRSSPIFAVSYATSLFSMFIMCNATQHGQLWTLAVLDMHPNKSTPLIVAVTICKTCAHLPPVQQLKWNINKPFSPMKKGQNLGNPNSVRS